MCGRDHRVVSSIVAILSLARVGPTLADGSAVTRSAPGERNKPTKPWLALTDYPRPPAPDTGWGIHDNPNCMWVPSDPDSFFKELKGKYGFSWFKVLACGANKIEVVKACRRQGVEPVVRIYADRPTPFYPREGEEEKEFRRLVGAYVKAGARYIESGNEPNLSLEWAAGEWDKPDRTDRVCRQWLRVRPMIVEEGGIPVFYAMSVGGEDKRSAGEWWLDCFETFKTWGKIEEAFAGTAFGVHLGTANHPLDYPFDAKRNMPHATRAERIDSLMKNNTCYLGVELLIHLMGQYLPHPIPILSTEGGTFPDNQDDKNYPKITPELHRDYNMGIFERFNPRHPEYWGDPLFAQMSWIHHTDSGIFAIDSWFDNPKYGRMPILDALEKAEKFDRGTIFRK
ncbi:MAG: hypothetical protein GX616_14155 [Planctomycetes bacterium]|nr:hypothetical protein [Planctomycetota bacterium]